MTETKNNTIVPRMTIGLVLSAILMLASAACGIMDEPGASNDTDTMIGKKEQALWASCGETEKAFWMIDGCSDMTENDRAEYCYWYVCNDDLWQGYSSQTCKDYCGGGYPLYNYYGTYTGSSYCESYWTLHCGCHCYHGSA